MGEISLTYKDVAFFLIGINILLGILFGLFPLIVGKKFGNGKFGTIGFFARASLKTKAASASTPPISANNTNGFRKPSRGDSINP